MYKFSKKKPFVLFEVLLGFALVCGAILPFLHYPFEDLKKEIELLYEMELERIAQNLLAETEIKLYRNEISSKWIFTKEEKTKQVNPDNDQITVELSKNWKRTFVKKIFVSWDRQKLSDDRLQSVLLIIEVQFFRQKTLIMEAQTKVLAQKKI